MVTGGTGVNGLRTERSRLISGLLYNFFACFWEGIGILGDSVCVAWLSYDCVYTGIQSP